MSVASWGGWRMVRGDGPWEAFQYFFSKTTSLASRQTINFRIQCAAVQWTKPRVSCFYLSSPPRLYVRLFQCQTSSSSDLSRGGRANQTTDNLCTTNPHTAPCWQSKFLPTSDQLFQSINPLLILLHQLPWFVVSWFSDGWSPEMQKLLASFDSVSPLALESSHYHGWNHKVTWVWSFVNFVFWGSGFYL